VICNKGGTTGPNGVSEFILTSHIAPVITTKHPPAERSGAEVRSHATAHTVHPLSLPDSRSQWLSRTTNLAARFSRPQCDMPTYTHKNGALRAFFALK
jgi:hypothetical protein